MAVRALAPAPRIGRGSGALRPRDARRANGARQRAGPSRPAGPGRTGGARRAPGWAPGIAGRAGPCTRPPGSLVTPRTACHAPNVSCHRPMRARPPCIRRSTPLPSPGSHAVGCPPHAVPSVLSRGVTAAPSTVGSSPILVAARRGGAAGGKSADQACARLALRHPGFETRGRRAGDASGESSVAAGRRCGEERTDAPRYGTSAARRVHRRLPQPNRSVARGRFD